MNRLAITRVDDLWKLSIFYPGSEYVAYQANPLDLLDLAKLIVSGDGNEEEGEHEISH